METYNGQPRYYTSLSLGVSSPVFNDTENRALLSEAFAGFYFSISIIVVK